MSYNGWTNKETWLVNLWLGDYLADMQDEGHSVTHDYIRDLVDDLCQAQAGLMSDLLNCALGEINYREIAEYYVTETEESEDA